MEVPGACVHAQAPVSVAGVPQDPRVRVRMPGFPQCHGPRCTRVTLPLAEDAWWDGPIITIRGQAARQLLESQASHATQVGGPSQAGHQQHGLQPGVAPWWLQAVQSPGFVCPIGTGTLASRLPRGLEEAAQHVGAAWAGR